MNADKLFAIIRRLKGEGLTQAEVNEINDALDGDVFSETPFRADPELIEQLKIDEGVRLTAYKDTVGVWTVGYGHAHVAPGTVWTQAQAEKVLVEDVIEHNARLAAALPWVNDLDPVRRRVLQNMAFNLGVGDAEKGTGLLGFKNTLRMIREGAYGAAADNMLQSKWAKQVKGRAVRLANRMRTGVEP